MTPPSPPSVCPRTWPTLSSGEWLVWLPLQHPAAEHTSQSDRPGRTWPSPPALWSLADRSLRRGWRGGLGSTGCRRWPAGEGTGGQPPVGEVWLGLRGLRLVWSLCRRGKVNVYNVRTYLCAMCYMLHCIQCAQATPHIVCTCTYMHMHTYMCMYICTHMHRCTYAHTNTTTYIRTCTNAFTHTHSPSRLADWNCTHALPDANYKSLVHWQQLKQATPYKNTKRHSYSISHWIVLTTNGVQYKHVTATCTVGMFCHCYTSTVS